MTDTLSHWDKVYQSKDHTQVSWHQNHATLSFDWILAYTDKNANIIDVGSGVSILADNLLDEGYTHLSLLELSLTAIQATKERLKSYSNRVNFYNENILDFETDTQYDLWHDRAVFHFLTDEKDQQTYLNKLNQYLKPQGYFLLATFAPTGPKQCSGLDIVQYDKDKIVPLLGDSFTLIKTTSETPPPPNGRKPHLNYFFF
jgi:2-polyprenyl-3-methyl-5-hydroxy-6-metoxy-1,4-benzoquinol methylase